MVREKISFWNHAKEVGKTDGEMERERQKYIKRLERKSGDEASGVWQENIASSTRARESVSGTTHSPIPSTRSWLGSELTVTLWKKLSLQERVSCAQSRFGRREICHQATINHPRKLPERRRAINHKVNSTWSHADSNRSFSLWNAADGRVKVTLGAPCLPSSWVLRLGKRSFLNQARRFLQLSGKHLSCSIKQIVA